jgi:hypothetical protein
MIDPENYISQKIQELKKELDGWEAVDNIKIYDNVKLINNPSYCDYKVRLFKVMDMEINNYGLFVKTYNNEWISIKNVRKYEGDTTSSIVKQRLGEL